jgi:hypothetical protein
MGLGCTLRKSGSLDGGETLDASMPRGRMITVSALARAENGRRAAEGLGASERHCVSPITSRYQPILTF